MRRAEEWGRVVAQLPLDRVFQIDYRLLSDRLAEIPDDANEILRLFDGQRTLAQVIEKASHEDLAGVRILSRLLVEKIIQPVESETRIEPHDEARVQDAAREGDDANGSGLGGTEDWFAGPTGAEPAAAPARAQAGLADGPPGAGARGDLPPRIVRFPARPRAGRDPRSDALSGVRHGPAPGRRPEAVAHDRAPRVNAAPAQEIVPAGALHPVQGDARMAKRRSLVVALLVGSALVATGFGIWAVVASRPAAPVESATPTATPISAPIGPDSSK